jgi:hypothetical protein
MESHHGGHRRLKRKRCADNDCHEKIYRKYKGVWYCKRHLQEIKLEKFNAKVEIEGKECEVCLEDNIHRGATSIVRFRDMESLFICNYHLSIVATKYRDLVRHTDTGKIIGIQI